MTLSCHACGAGDLREIQGFAALPRVSSDCRPVTAGGALACCAACGLAQKPATPEFHADAAAIYAAYDVYYQGGGAEQLVFDPRLGGALRRSELLADRIRATAALPAGGQALDIGCGNGAFLRAFGARFADWRLSGLELDDRNLPALRQIPGFTALLQGEIRALCGPYGFVSLLHALEHLTDPLTSLAALRRCMTPEGVLFIQVPNLAANPFDLLIADHASHFTPPTLRRLLRRAGWAVKRLETGWVTKEISVLARPDPTGAEADARLADGPGLADRCLAWLSATLDAARAAARRKPFGVFGTSIAGTWLAGALADEIDFFVDEDSSRIGRSFAGRPVRAPGTEPPDATLFLGLAPAVAQALAPRLARPGLHLVHPPAFEG